MFTTLTEVGVLVNGTGDKGGYRGDFLLVRAKDVWETGRESSRRLSCAEMKFSNIVTAQEG